MSIMGLRRRMTTVLGAMAVTLAASAVATAPQAAAVGNPSSCDKFQITYIQRDNGAALEWVLDAKCYWSPEIGDVVVTTYENGVERDVRRIPPGNKLVGRTTGYVLLPPRPICAASRIRVEAKYGYMAIGNETSTEGVLYLDPNDNC